MASSPALSQADWLGACRAAVAGLRDVMREHPTSRERVVETGTLGEGGDRTLVIDQLAEDIVFAELERLHDAGARFTAVSEERGVVDFGGRRHAGRDRSDRRVDERQARADPPRALDRGGRRADDGRRPLRLRVRPRPGRGVARGGAAAARSSTTSRCARSRSGARTPGKLELVAIESADPRWLAASSEALCDVAHRVRAMGSIAISLCQVAPTRVDGMATLWKSRAVDCAAAQLIVRESGGLVRFPGLDTPLGAPLDLEPHWPVVAARTPEALEQLAALPRM